MRTIKVIPKHCWSWRRRGSVFFALFVGIWAFLDPFFTLVGNVSLLSVKGIWGYMLLLVIAMAITGLIETLNRRHLLSVIEFIPIEVVLTETGERLSVEAPRDIRVREFVRLFLREVQSFGDGITLSRLHEMYNITLAVGRNGKYEEVDPDLTLDEAGVKPGSVCKIIGEIKPEYQRVEACYIATTTAVLAENASWAHLALNSLRKWRNRHLRLYSLGRALEKVYKLTAPRVARYSAKHPMLAATFYYPFVRPAFRLAVARRKLDLECGNAFSCWSGFLIDVLLWGIFCVGLVYGVSVCGVLTFYDRVTGLAMEK